jgi:hypothetical protein
LRTNLDSSTGSHSYYVAVKKIEDA